MSELKKLLSNIKIEGVTKRLTIGVSYGFSDFSGTEKIEQAIKNADGEMYRVKQENKQLEKTEETSFLPADESVYQLIST